MTKYTVHSTGECPVISNDRLWIFCTRNRADASNIKYYYCTVKSTGISDPLITINECQYYLTINY